MSQDKSIKSIWNISQSHIPATPLILAGLLSCFQLLLPLSPQPLPLLLQTVPSSKALTSLSVSSSNLLTYQKRVRKPLHAQSCPVQLVFVSLLVLRMYQQTSQLTSDSRRASLQIKVRFYLFVPNLLLSCTKLARVWAPWTSPLHCSCQTFYTCHKLGTLLYPVRSKLGFKSMLAYFLPYQNKAHKKEMWGLPEGAGKTRWIIGNFWKEIWEVDFTHSLYW